VLCPTPHLVLGPLRPVHARVRLVRLARLSRRRIWFLRAGARSSTRSLCTCPSSAMIGNDCLGERLRIQADLHCFRCEPFLHADLFLGSLRDQHSIRTDALVAPSPPTPTTKKKKEEETPPPQKKKRMPPPPQRGWRASPPTHPRSPRPLARTPPKKTRPPRCKVRSLRSIRRVTSATGEPVPRRPHREPKNHFSLPVSVPSPRPPKSASEFFFGVTIRAVTSASALSLPPARARDVGCDAQVSFRARGRLGASRLATAARIHSVKLPRRAILLRRRNAPMSFGSRPARSATMRISLVRPIARALRGS